MEALIHLIVSCVKIALLASLYLFVIKHLLVFLMKRGVISKETKLFDRFQQHEGKSWWLIALFLFIWMHSFWGNHGFGDSARIPIGKGVYIFTINWNDCAVLNGVKTAAAKDVHTTSFAFQKGIIMGNMKSDFYDYYNNYFVYDTKTALLKEFPFKKGYNEYAEKHGLVPTVDFKSFNEHYKAYWHTWRFFLLP